SFFNITNTAEHIQKIAILFRSGNGSKVQRNADASDMYIPVYTSGQLAVRIDTPLRDSRFVPQPETITKVIGNNIFVKAVASQSADLNLKFNGTSFQTATGATAISGTSGNIIASGNQQIIAEATVGANTVRDTINFFVAPPANQAPLPANVKDGINYITSDSVVLVLFAPGKSRVSVIGDFNNWTEQSNYQMNIDTNGRRYWLGIGKLTSGQEYGFQYYVNGTLKIADPYCEKILDPNNDQYISSATYPNPTTYPTGKTSGIVGVLKTGATAYNWTASGYSRPDKKNLVIYELLVRDFVAAQNYQTLTDTLNYLQNLGVNAIELMPFNEFEGNNSWGYNPDYFFALDKAYGTKDKLKLFVDECHKRGIAVIMDAVFNHATGLSPLAQLYWDAANNRPAANNPWLNITATHPYSVFNDFNHESDITKYHVSRFIRYWLTEYKLDGFRWDLSKGFTQKVSADVGTWNAYDATRINIWQRYYDSIQSVSPGAYCILEHLGNDDEEAELARRGMMLWGKMTDQYNQNTMGYTSNIDISRAYWTNRSFWNDGTLNDKPNLVVYAESQDEERTMYKNVTFGNSSGGYNVKDTATALQREEAKAAILLMVPGPKMIWQFEEIGYDKSIFMCENGTVPTPYGTDNCKVNPKPAGWGYFNFANANARKKLYNVYGALNRLRTQFPGVFNSRTIATGTSFGSLYKTIVLDSSSLKVVVVANFDVVQQSVSVTFPQTGTWYSYLTGSTLNVAGATQNITLQPGEYYVYLNKVVAGGIVTAVKDVILSNKDFKITVYPNPVQRHSTVDYELPESGKVTISVRNITGQNLGVVNKGFQLKGMQRFILNSSNFGSSMLSPGSYLLEVRVNNKVRIEKFVVQQ
ncbi:MAG: T9SS type A sorting domain-containing protein, partial [Sphingobacteriales bacterium]|nr:T9SS type A sorting domain-containing protein [Sphingobacteriales bacterium]